MRSRELFCLAKNNNNNNNMNALNRLNKTSFLIKNKLIFFLSHNIIIVYTAEKQDVQLNNSHCLVVCFIIYFLCHE